MAWYDSTPKKDENRKKNPHFYELTTSHSEFVNILDKNQRTLSYSTNDHLPLEPRTAKDNPYNIANILTGVEIGDSIQLECDPAALKRMIYTSERDRLCRGVELIVERIEEDKKNHSKHVHFRINNKELSPKS